MEQLVVAVIAALVGGVLFVAGYHALVMGPSVRRLTAALATHDALLGGSEGARASARLEGIEAASFAVSAAVATFSERITELERVASSEVPRVGFVRYNAFDDVGSDLSYALALLTRDGNGVVLSSIFSREETRTYGKAVRGFTPSHDASQEELSAIAQAKAMIG